MIYALTNLCHDILYGNGNYAYSFIVQPGPTRDAVNRDKPFLRLNISFFCFYTDWSLDTSLFEKRKDLNLNVQCLRSFSVSKHPFQSCPGIVINEDQTDSTPSPESNEKSGP